jgi:hypothetical protein
VTLGDVEDEKNKRGGRNKALKEFLRDEETNELNEENIKKLVEITLEE